MRQLLNVEAIPCSASTRTRGRRARRRVLREQFGLGGAHDAAEPAAPPGDRRRAAARHRPAARPRRVRRRPRPLDAGRRRGASRRRRRRRAFKAVRGEYGSGKTFFARWLGERAKKRRLRHAPRCRSPRPRRRCTGWRPSTGGSIERLATADVPQGALGTCSSAGSSPSRRTCSPPGQSRARRRRARSGASTS